MDQQAINRFGEQTVENCRRAFSSIFSSMLTLFAQSIGDQWHDNIAFPIITTSSVKPWVFASTKLPPKFNLAKISPKFHQH